MSVILRADDLRAVHVGSAVLPWGAMRLVHLTSDGVIAVYPAAPDPHTGRHQLEQLAFGIASTQSLGDAGRKARELADRGVRRVFAIDIERSRALEWSAELGTRRQLDPAGHIEDLALAVPLPIEALVHAAKADDAVARALIAKGNPVLIVGERDPAQLNRWLASASKGTQWLARESGARPSSCEACSAPTINGSLRTLSGVRTNSVPTISVRYRRLGRVLPNLRHLVGDLRSTRGVRDLVG